jgi:hypothetical protein
MHCGAFFFVFLPKRDESMPFFFFNVHSLFSAFEAEGGQTAILRSLFNRQQKGLLSEHSIC